MVESFDQALGHRGGGVNASVVHGSMHAAAQNDLINPINFGTLGTFRSLVKMHSGFNVVTLRALAGVNVFVLNLLTTHLTATEVQILEQFVRPIGGGLEIQNADQLRQGRSSENVPC